MAASGREGAPATLGRVRAQPRRQAARALELLRRGRHLDPGGGRTHAREGADLRRHPHARRDRLPRRRARRRTALRGARRCRASTSTRSSRPARRSSSPAPTRTPPRPQRVSRASASTWSARDDLGKVSIVGAGMKSHPGVAARTFATLEELGIEPEIVTHLADQDRLLRRRDAGRGRASRRCTAPSSSTPEAVSAACLRPASASSAPPAPSGRSRWSCSPSAASTTSARSRRPGRPAPTSVRRAALRGRGGDAGGARGAETSTSASSPSAPARARELVPPTADGRRDLHRQVGRLPAHRRASRSSSPA